MNYVVLLAVYLTVIVPGCHGVVRDVVYIIDKSGSVRESDFDEAIVFVYNVTEWLTIGPNDIQVSIVTYSTSTSLEFHLNRYTTNDTLLEGINALKGTRTTGYTYTYDALDYVRENSFLSSNGGRSNALRTVIVMTDGLSNDQSRTIEAADNIRNETGAEVYSIGIGAAVSSSNDELRGIASDPDSYYVHYVDTYVYLCNLVPALVPKLDSNITNVLVNDCPTPPTTKGSYTTAVTDSTTGSDTTTTTETTTGSDTTTGNTDTTVTKDATSSGTVPPTDTAFRQDAISTETSDSTTLLVAAIVASLCAVAVGSAVVATIIRRKGLFQSEDEAILAAVQQYNHAPMGQTRPSFTYISN